MFSIFSPILLKCKSNTKLLNYIGNDFKKFPKYLIFSYLSPRSLYDKFKSKFSRFFAGVYFIAYSKYIIFSLLQFKWFIYKSSTKLYTLQDKYFRQLPNSKIYSKLPPKKLFFKNNDRCYRPLGINFITSIKYSMLFPSSPILFSDKSNLKCHKLLGSYLIASPKYFIFSSNLLPIYEQSNSNIYLYGIYFENILITIFRCKSYLYSFLAIKNI